ncbi:cysteine desulfurase [Sporosarcina sp. P21c]|uniref:IscS subfamily cysteine desulfurase n=1 Tax=unclassified Sporosarcina TaxID=2647733 RepID=UPI000C167BA9|nr:MULTISPECIES: IscS subfamily cysteine desulfurase [unclassified Sporosarcina]PIC68547.1 cysteine desulfurase [Sporosarcina sp. P16a]PIC91267.1 cysteine desulfurase [Sporosarcina sp. P21c]PIC93600.1 cysteine desulfurase [Sporosarcina sp. P25]
MHYFDYAATTPLREEAASVYVSVSQQQFGNTTSLHDAGGAAQNILSHSRQNLSALLGVRPEGIYFTSGGTESNILALLSLAESAKKKGQHIILSAAEHPSLHSAAAYLERQGFFVTFIPFTTKGFIDLLALENAITEQTTVVSVQHCNPEIGTIQPIRSISELIKPKGIYLHSDCVQSFGKLSVRAISPYVDSLSVSSHKVHGPKGVGAVYIDPHIRAVPLFPGATQEKGFRGGTMNVPGIAAFVTAAELANSNEVKYATLRSLFIDILSTQQDVFTFYGGLQTSDQLLQIIGLCAKHSEGQLIMLELNRRGFAISTGSACQVGQQQSSMTMTAMNIPAHLAKGFIRISFGETSTSENVTQLAKALLEVAVLTPTAQIPIDIL